MDFNDLEKGKFIKKQKISFDQISKHMQRAKKDIRTAKANKKIDPIWAYTIAYQGMLKAGRALMFLVGYKPIDGRQHVTVIEFVDIYLGKEYRDLINEFERMRRKRNNFLYEPGGSISEQELSHSLKKADKMIIVLEKIIKNKNPQKGFF